MGECSSSSSSSGGGSRSSSNGGARGRNLLVIRAPSKAAKRVKIGRCWRGKIKKRDERQTERDGGVLCGFCLKVSV